MNKKRLALAGLAAVILLATTTAAIADGGGLGNMRWLARIRRATREFQNIEKAQQEGYAALLGCLSDPQAGGMGYHYVQGELVSDTATDPLRPEALVYEKLKSGKLRLVALEYIVFQDVWDAEHPDGSKPRMLGQTFELKTSLVPFGVPPFYELHVWAWKHNPSGVFADWNPRVACPAE